MEKVLIEVIGTQNIDSQFDKTELKTVGTFEELILSDIRKSRAKGKRLLT